MNWLLWLSGLIGALLFTLGFFTGAWAQRTLAAQLEQWVQLREKKRQGDALEKAWSGPPGAAWGGAEIPGKGTEHPSGPVPPTPDQVRKAKTEGPRDWTKNLKTGKGLRIG